MTLQCINPKDLPIPQTYSQVVVATGSTSSRGALTARSSAEPGAAVGSRPQRDAVIERLDPLQLFRAEPWREIDGDRRVRIRRGDPAPAARVRRARPAGPPFPEHERRGRSGSREVRDHVTSVAANADRGHDRAHVGVGEHGGKHRRASGPRGLRCSGSWRPSASGTSPSGPPMQKGTPPGIRWRSPRRGTVHHQAAGGTR